MAVGIDPFYSDRDYYDDIKDALDYDFFYEGDDVIIKVKFDEILQHSGVAFPATILLKKTEITLDCTFKSKSLPTVYSETIHLENE